jgi:transcriptional regulator with XRE-family HTH domain
MSLVDASNFSPDLFGKYLTAWMTAQGMTEKQLANYLGLQRTTVHAMLTGAIIPARKLVVIKALAVKLKCPEDFVEVLILGRKDLFVQQCQDLGLKMLEGQDLGGW